MMAVLKLVGKVPFSKILLVRCSGDAISFKVSTFILSIPGAFLVFRLLIMFMISVLLVGSKNMEFGMGLFWKGGRVEG